MAFGEANRIDVSYAVEVTPGTTPAVAFQKIPFKTTSIEANVTTTTTQSIRSDRMKDDLLRMSASTAGDIGVETTFGNHDPFMESAFGADFVTFTLTAATISAASADNSFNDSGSGFNTTTLKPGMYIKTSGFVTPANNGVHLIVSVATGKIVVSAASTLVVEAAGPTVTVAAKTLRTGTNKKFFSIQRAFNDIGEYSIHRGMIVSNFTLNAVSASIVESNFSFMGQSTTWAGTSFSTGAEVAAPAWEALTATANVSQIYEAGVDTAISGIKFKSINLAVNPNVRELQAIGSLYAVAHNLGSFDITATAEAYFDDSDMIQKFLDGTATSLSYKFTDPSGDMYVVYLPYCKLSTGGTNGIALNSDVMQNITFTALLSPTEGFMAQISKL
jgi:hypothetical protein